MAATAPGITTSHCVSRQEVGEWKLFLLEALFIRRIAFGEDALTGSPPCAARWLESVSLGFVKTEKLRQ